MLTGSDLSRRRLPLMVMESGISGPTVWITACVHGDEVGGMVIIQELFRMFRRGGLKKGAIHAFPLMNPIGFETHSRFITVSREDLNRSFPGDPNGSLAERIADRIFSTITNTNPFLVLDLHNDWMKSVPYCAIDADPGPEHSEAYEFTRIVGEISGFLEVLDRDELTGTLSHSLICKGIPALTFELGESFVVNEKNVMYGVKSILNILSHLEMIDPVREPFSHYLAEVMRGRTLIFSSRPVSATSGITRFAVRPGDIIKKGRIVARIYNPFGKLQETVRAFSDAVVLGHADSSVAFPGAPIMAFGNM
jgi:predicted deacylase